MFSLFHVKGRATPCKLTTGLINMFKIHAALTVLQQSKGFLQKKFTASLVLLCDTFPALSFLYYLKCHLDDHDN